MTSVVRYSNLVCISLAMGFDMVCYTVAGAHHLHTVPGTGAPREAEEVEGGREMTRVIHTPFRDTYLIRYPDPDRSIPRLLTSPDANKGTWIYDRDLSVAILPDHMFRKWLVVSFDLELFLRNDISPELDYCPFGKCPFAGTTLIVDENGNVLSSGGDLVLMTC